MTTTNRVRFNFAAIVVAAFVNFVLEAVWYGVFLNVWLSGIGHDRKWLMSSGMNEWVQHGTAFLCTIVMAIGISWFTQKTGPQTALRGIKIGLLIWFFFVVSGMAINDIYAIRPIGYFLVNSGFWIIGFPLIGAITGAWKKK